MNKSSTQISDKIRKLPIAGIKGFGSRISRKIEFYGFISGFELMLRQNQHSLLSWSMGISRFTGKLLSKQGLDKRLSSIDPNYFKVLLNRVLAQQLKAAVKISRPNTLFKHFTKVLVEDSTCIGLPSNLSSHFAGAHNRHGQSATARIQLRMDLLSESYCSIDLQSYRDNDQKHSYEILKTLKSGQLVIRDLGYWALGCFKGIIAQQAYFLSRFKYGPMLRLAGQQEWMTIVDLLNSQRKPNKRQIDCIVEIGKSAKLKVRLIALKAPKKVVEQRKVKARKDRNQKANHSKAYFEFLNWTVLIASMKKQ